MFFSSKEATQLNSPFYLLLLPLWLHQPEFVQPPTRSYPGSLPWKWSRGRWCRRRSRPHAAAPGPCRSWGSPPPFLSGEKGTVGGSGPERSLAHQADWLTHLPTCGDLKGLSLSCFSSSAKDVLVICSWDATWQKVRVAISTGRKEQTSYRTFRTTGHLGTFSLLRVFYIQTYSSDAAPLASLRLSQEHRAVIQTPTGRGMN